MTGRSILQRAPSLRGLGVAQRTDSIDPVSGLKQPVSWTLVYLTFLAYAFAMTTGRFPIGTSAAVAGLVLLLVQRQPLQFPRMFLWLLLFIVWGGVGYATTAYPEQARSGLFGFVRFAMIVLLATNALRSRSQVQFYLLFVLACFLLYPVRGAYFLYYVANVTTFGRAIAGGLYANANDLAAITLLQLSVAGAIFVGDGRRLVRVGALFAVVVLAFLIILTQSRGVYLGSIGFVALLVGTHRRKVRALLGIVCVLGLIGLVAPSNVWERFGRLGNLLGSPEPSVLGQLDDEGSAEGRWEIYRFAVRIIADHPLTGVGLQAYPLANAQYASAAQTSRRHRGLEIVRVQSGGAVDTHSTYLNVAAETGIPGLLIFVSMIGSVMAYAERARRRCIHRLPRVAAQLALLEAGFAGYLIASAVATNTSLAITYVQAAVLWSLAHAARGELDSRASEGSRAHAARSKGWGRGAVFHPHTSDPYP